MKGRDFQQISFPSLSHTAYWIHSSAKVCKISNLCVVFGSKFTFQSLALYYKYYQGKHKVLDFINQFSIDFKDPYTLKPLFTKCLSP